MRRFRKSVWGFGISEFGAGASGLGARVSRFWGFENSGWDFKVLGTCAVVLDLAPPISSMVSRRGETSATCLLYTSPSPRDRG
eukprot:3564871-Rhodomonas_salina.1